MRYLLTMNLTLENKVALITGGSRGIGAAAVRMFVEADAKVVFNYQSAKAQAEKLVNGCGPANCRAIQCDLTGTATAEQLVSATIAAFGRLDILVANHGIWPSDDIAIDQISDEQWRRTMSVNLDAVFALVKHAVPRSRGTHRADQFHQRPARRGLPLRLLRHQRRADQHDENAFERTGPRRHPHQLRSSRMGQHRYVR